MSGAKETSRGWPEPNDWVKGLEDALSKQQELFDSTQEGLAKRRLAATMLGIVISALQQLPPFHDVRLLMGLKHLRFFMEDIELGRDHAWLKSDGYGGNKTPSAETERKLWIRAILAVFLANGFRRVEAYKQIAADLNNSGRSLGTGRPIPWRRVGEWCREAPDDVASQDHARKKIEVWWREYRDAAQPGEELAGLSSMTRKRLAARFAQEFWSLDFLTDRTV